VKDDRFIIRAGGGTGQMLSLADERIYLQPRLKENRPSPSTIDFKWWFELETL